jgi:hypothetical protein
MNLSALYLDPVCSQLTGNNVGLRREGCMRNLVLCSFTTSRSSDNCNVSLNNNIYALYLVLPSMKPAHWQQCGAQKSRVHEASHLDFCSAALQCIELFHVLQVVLCA